MRSNRCCAIIFIYQKRLKDVFANLKKQNRLFTDLNLGETTMKVDESLCIGCGLCVRIAPDCFYLTEEEKSAVKKGADKNSPQAQQAMASCPMAAIYED